MRNSIDGFLASTNKKLKAFRKNHLGSVTQITAVAALPMFLAAGAAIDTVRINREQVAFDAAVDAATLAVAADDRASLAGLSTSQQASRIAELEAFARQYMAENYTPQYGSNPDMAVNIVITGSTIDLYASHDFPTTIMKLTGIEQINLHAHSQVMKAMRPIELAMVMDTTGSMASSGKIEGAKAAAHQLLNTLYSGSVGSVPQSEFIRVALVPFAAAVRLDPGAYDYKSSWVDTTGLNPLSKLNFTDPAWNNYMAWGKLKTSSSTHLTWNGCVEARMTGSAASGLDYNVNDAAPTTATPATLFPAYFSPDTPSIRNRSPYSSSFKGVNYAGTYIDEDADTPDPVPDPTPDETTGMTLTQAATFTTAGLMVRQKNQAKYDQRIISAETLAATDGPWAGCAKSAIVPLTHNRANVEAGIDAMA
ncbi:MAG: pilus assembly protein TadG-related protein, partial [Aestuariivirga sp.]